MFIGLLKTGYPTGILIVGPMMLLTGLFVAGIFAYASLIGTGGQRDRVSPLYAADLIGGCLGSLLGSLFMIPFLGLVQSAVILSIVCLLAVALL